jgi:hypothetical protein
VRLRLGVILSLPMLLCAAAPSARAGCANHYLAVRTQQVAETHALDPLLLSRSALPSREGLPPARPTPCSGAFCSGNPAVPPSTAPLSLPEGDGHWAISLFPPAVADPGSLARPGEDARLAPVNQPSSVFHPPRRPTA